MAAKKSSKKKEVVDKVTKEPSPGLTRCPKCRRMYQRGASHRC